MTTHIPGWEGSQGPEDDEPPFFPERRSEIADHLREVRAVLDEREQLAAANERAQTAERKLEIAFETTRRNIEFARQGIAELGARVNEAETGHDHWLCYASDLELKLGTERGRAEKVEAENAELRARLDGLGELREEWRADQPSGAWNMSHNRPTESTARAVVETTRKMGYPVVLQQRLVGQWREVDQTEEENRG